MASSLRRKIFFALGALLTVVYLSTRSSSGDLPSYVSPLRFPHPSALPLTKIHVKAAGYHLFENLYVREGIMYLVVNDPDHPNIPELRQMTSSGLPDSVGVKPREPSSDHMRIVTKEEAGEMLKGPVVVMEGFSVSPKSSHGGEKGRGGRWQVELVRGWFLGSGGLWGLQSSPYSVYQVPLSSW